MAVAGRDIETWGLIFLSGSCLAYTLVSLISALRSPITIYDINIVFQILVLWISERGLWYRKLYVSDSNRIVMTFGAETIEIKNRISELEKMLSEIQLQNKEIIYLGHLNHAKHG